MNSPKIIDDNLYIPGFSVLGTLGLGNQSTVYLARQRSLNRLVAIKTVRNEDKSSYASKRLQREGQIVAKLELSNVVRLHERFDVGDQAFVVLEYVGGGNLRQRMNEGRLLPQEVARLTISIARTMDEVHQQGVVHLDLKPENILLTTSGEPKISDFGLAVAIGSEAHCDSLHDSTFEIEGTPWYMAPEQIEKSQYANLPTTDVYAIGIIIYEMLTGRPPFLASDRNELFERICRYPPLAPRQLHPQIPPDLETICLRCLVKNPAERYRSAGELAHDLDRWLHHQPIRARKVGYTERLRLWRRRNPIVASLVLCSMLTLCVASIGFIYNYAATFQALNLSSRHEQDRQANLVRSLRTVDPKSLPLLIETFQTSDETYAPLLVDAARQQDLSLLEETRYRLALIGEQTDFPGQLPRTLLETDVTEFESIVRVLERSKGRCRPEAWEKYLEVLQGTFENNSVDRKERFRSATALVHHGSQRDWTAEEYERIADGLLSTDPLQVLTFSELLSPIHDRLIGSLLERCKDPRLANFHRRIAVNLLAEYAREQPAVLTELLLSSDMSHFLTFMVPLLEHTEETTAVLKREMESETSNGNREERRSRTIRQSRAALGLLRLGYAEIVWPLLRASKDTSLRSEIIHSLRDAGVGLTTLVSRYPIESDVSAQRALLLAMGNFPSDELSSAERDKLLEQVLLDYQSHPDPGIHTACEWLIKQWRVPIPVVTSNDACFQDAVDRRRDWFVNTQGQSFTVIRGPIDVRLGSPDDEPDREPIEIPCTVTIDRTFAIGMREVTIEEFKKFTSEAGAPLNSEWEPTWPATNMTYLDAARYCRWLSEREGIPEDQMCYPPVQEIKEGFVANPNYLRRTGYRLPSEAEQECSMRAGATTRFCFGESDELLGEYAWYIKNAYEAPRPTGLLKPNDYGLFDAHGNVRELGQEWISHTGGDSILKTGQRKHKLDIEDMTPIVNVGHYRIARSGSFKDFLFNIRCSRRDKMPILSASVDMGIRLARTLVHHPKNSVR